MSVSRVGQASKRFTYQNLLCPTKSGLVIFFLTQNPQYKSTVHLRLNLFNAETNTTRTEVGSGDLRTRRVALKGSRGTHSTCCGGVLSHFGVFITQIWYKSQELRVGHLWRDKWTALSGPLSTSGPP